MKFFPTGNRQSSQGLPILPDAVDDNMYLAAASKAAELDKSSGAYDHFLFEELALRNMPFETAVDAHLNLVSLRLEDRGRRELLEAQKKTLAGKAQAEIAQMKLNQLEDNLSDFENQLEEQRAVLSSQKPGRHGLMWPGTVPSVTTQLSGLARAVAPYLIFLIVGLVDVLIVYYSLNSIPGFDNLEPVFFSAPVIGVQLIFPHLIGQRLSLLSRGSQERIRNWLEFAVFLCVWVTFAVALTFVRMDYIAELAKNDLEPLSGNLYTVLGIANFLMLIGLGSWLLFLESRRNYHEHDALRIKLRILVLEKQRQNAMVALEERKNAVPSLELAESVARASFEDAVKTAGSGLGEAAKAIYRRSLVNQMGTPEFTSSYIGVDAPKRAR